jgi:uncharacterized protein
MPTRSELEDQFSVLVRSSDWLMQVLRAARACDPRDWVIGAGVVRNLVWNHPHGYSQPTPARDVDLAYFDALDLRPEAERAWEDRLHSAMPAVPWEVKNQAAVHLWYAQRLDSSVPPLESIEAAVASWPEMAAAVAVRLLSDDRLAVIAPFGLTDLFHMISFAGTPNASRWTSTDVATGASGLPTAGRAARSWTRRDGNAFRTCERPFDATVTPMIRSRRCSAEPSRLVL